jgi:hypothetical protein
MYDQVQHLVFRTLTQHNTTQIPPTLLAQVVLAATELYTHLSVWGTDTTKPEALQQIRTQCGDNKFQVHLPGIAMIVQVCMCLCMEPCMCISKYQVYLTPYLLLIDGVSLTVKD